MRVSHSRIKTWRRCERAYYYKYEQRLRPKLKNKNLEMGSWVHELLMYYRDGENWLDRHRLKVVEFNDYFEEEREALGHDLPSECLRLVRSYIRQYGKKDQRDFTVIDTELDEIVTLPDGTEVNVIIDLVVEDRKGGLWGWDYKTRTSFDPKDLILLDPQYSIYYGAMEILGYRKMRGFIVDEIRKKAPTVPRLLKGGGLSKARSIDTDVWTYMSAIRENGLNPNRYSDILEHIATTQKDRFFRRTYLPKDPPVLKTVIAEAQSSTAEMQRARDLSRRLGDTVYTRTVDKSCVWGCDYRDICIVDLHGGDSSTMKKMHYTTRERKDN